MSRIVIDARESGTSTGRYVDKLIEHMHKLKPGHEIIILAKAHRVDFMRGIAPSFQIVETAYREFTFGEQLGFKKQIESLHPDLVHFAIVQQPVWYGGRVVTTMHDLTTIRFRNPAKNPIVFTIKQLVYKWVNRRVARKSRLIMTPTQYVKDDIAQYTHINPDKIIVTPESADMITDAPQPVKALEGKQFIMYVGRPTPHKNLGRLIEAFAIMQKTNPDLCLALAGKKDPLYEAHERRAQELSVKNIIFTGFITEAELAWMYQNTACYVVPSLSEGFGLPGVEAMKNGAPVASSNLTCLPEVYGDAAAYFDPLDIREVGEAVLDVVNNAKLADELRARGRKHAATFSWGRMAEQTLEAYAKALL